MSDMQASVTETKNGFHVQGYEKIDYDFTFIDGVFDPSKPQLANCYKGWGRCLVRRTSQASKLRSNDDNQGCHGCQHLRRVL